MPEDKLVKPTQNFCNFLLFDHCLSTDNNLGVSDIVTQAHI